MGKIIVSEGIPLINQYKELIESPFFEEMEIFSNRFMKENSIFLHDYMRKWVGDPLHQWSRQWEYPYVLSRLQQIPLSDEKHKILDAGSGVTFFPYYLNRKLDNASIYCCDYDPMLSKIYHKINSRQEKKVEFSTNDLRDLSYENEIFHAIYCISVLEHTKDYEAIIKEFFRVLIPGGVLIVTFDISLDGTQDIDVDKAETLLISLGKRFDMDKELLLDLHSQLTAQEIFTTLKAKDINPSLLPWKAPAFLYRIKSYLSTGRFGSWPPPLSVFCLSLTKRLT